MEGIGGYIWFIGLGVALVGLAIAIGYGRAKGRRVGGDPNHAWKQAAAEAHDPAVAQPPKTGG